MDGATSNGIVSELVEIIQRSRVPDASLPSEEKNTLAALREHEGKVYDPMGRPDEIYAVPGLPRNLAAKIPRAVLRGVYEGEDPGGLSSLDNPQILEEIRKALRR